MSSIKIRTKLIEGKTQIRMLISHPMEHGRRKNEQRETIPAHYIQELTVKHNETIIMSGALGIGVSKDPYFSFMLQGGESGDRIQVSWKDNLGNIDTQIREIGG
jgi:sulfur-oxidizing protein SoxZ